MLNEKNEKDYKLEKNILFGEKGRYYWPGTVDEAIFLLRQTPYSPNKKHLIEAEPISDCLENLTQTWSFATFVNSALYFVLEEDTNERIKNKQNFLNIYDWPLIIPLMFNSSINKEVILFIEQNYKVPYDFLIEAAHFSIKRLFLFDQLKISEKSLNDFLIFLKVDILSREILVKKSFRDQNFDQLVDFLSALNSSLNRDLILSEVLENYNDYIKNENFYFDVEKIEIKILELLELNRDSLQTFNIFDMFDSSELSKSKNSELIFFSFYENLLKESNSSLREDLIEIFKLFEKFLNTSKDKSILLIDISFEKSSRFYQFIQSFYFSYEQQIKSILKEKSRFFIKFYQAGISFETLGIGSLLTFVAILQILEVKSTKRLIYPPTQSGCFATISSRFVQDRTATQVELEYETFKQVSASATLKPFQQKRTATLLQNRPLPRNTTLIGNRSKSSGIVTFSKTSLASGFDTNLVNPSQKSTKIIVEGQLRFDNLSAADCVDLLVNDIEKKFPGSNITIRSTLETRNGIIQEVNEITINETVSQFGRLDRIKSDIIKGVKQTDGTILFSSPQTSERDHPLNSVTRDVFHIKEDRGAAVFVGKLLHDKIGKERTFVVPSGMGYTPGTGGSLSLIDHFCEQDKRIIGKISNESEVSNFLTSKKSSPDKLERAYTSAFKLDQELIRDRMGDDMNENAHLAMSHASYLNEKTAEEFHSLSDRISANPHISMEEVGESLSQILEQAQPRREHTYAVKALLKEGTPACIEVERCETRAVNAARELIMYVEKRGGIVNSTIKDRFLSETSSDLISPEEAYTEATKNKVMGLENLKNPLKPLVGPTRFVPNYPKK